MAVDSNLDSRVHIDKDQTVFDILARRGGFTFLFNMIDNKPNYGAEKSLHNTCLFQALAADIG